MVRSVVFGLLCCLAVASAIESSSDLSSESDLKRMPELTKTMASMNSLRLLFRTKQDSVNSDCSCTNLNCECCKDIKIKKIHLHEKCCLKLNYDPKSGDVTVSLTIGSRNIWSKTFPVGQPPSTCIDFEAAKVCLDFHDFHVDSKTFTGCSKLTFRLFGHKIAEVELGCFHVHFLDTTATANHSADSAPLIRMLEALKMFDAAQKAVYENGAIAEDQDFKNGRE